MITFETTQDLGTAELHNRRLELLYKGLCLYTHDSDSILARAIPATIFHQSLHTLASTQSC